MQPSRRDIFRAGVAGAVAVGFGACDGTSGSPVSTSAGQIPAAALVGAPYSYSLATFSPHVGSRFELTDGAGARASMTLVRATDVGIAGRPVVDKAECFALAFEGEGGSTLGQDTYETTHAVLGSFPLFIVPGAAPASGSSARQTYSAVFNRI
jgi:hypothetical protein